MIFDAASFVFKPPLEVAFARRVLIKPGINYAKGHPFTTSRETVEAIITGIRKASDADILILEGGADGKAMHSIFRELGYSFPRTMTLDVNECALLEVENPLAKPYALSTFWVPSVILSCDFLITMAPFQVMAGRSHFSIPNLLGLLPASKYPTDAKDTSEFWERFGVDSLIADLYFTLPFDLGIIDGRKRLISPDDTASAKTEDYGKILVGPPYEVDRKATEIAGAKAEYLQLIEKAETEQPV